MARQRVGVKRIKQAASIVRPGSTISRPADEVDVAIVGAGFAGLYWRLLFYPVALRMPKIM
jgi:hypothetical protein